MVFALVKRCGCMGRGKFLSQSDAKDLMGKKAFDFLVAFAAFAIRERQRRGIHLDEIEYFYNAFMFLNIEAGRYYYFLSLLVGSLILLSQTC